MRGDAPKCLIQQYFLFKTHINLPLSEIMAETNDTSANENTQEIDLSSLSSLAFNPDWATDNARKISIERSSRTDFRENGARGTRKEFVKDAGFSRDRREKRDRRTPRPPRTESPATKDETSPENSRRPSNGKNRHPDSRRRNFKPDTLPPLRVADIMIYPEDKPFTVLAKAIKNSARTYVLFEVAKIILEKPERFLVVISPLQKKDKAGKPIPGNEPLPPLYLSVPDGLPFLNEQDAVAHVFKNHLDKFFTLEEVEAEAPKGNFTMIAKCGFTGELLAPPNYHAYQQILRDHHATNFPKMAFERFMSRIETVKDAEAINAWIEKMRKVTRYTLKDRRDDEPESFDNVGAAKAFVLATRKDEAVKPVKQIRLSGKLIEKMPIGPLKTNIEHEIVFQQKFPLNTANGFRGRLRHMGFSLYKKGSKGITMVCGVKRKFRTPTSVFSDTIQRVFDFLEKNPGTPIKELPAKMLGLEEPQKAETPAESDSVPAPAPLAETPEAKELVGTVRWLVTEGYVSEMSDGKLYAHPVMTEAQAKAAANAEQPIERPEIPQVDWPEDNIASNVPEAPKPLIKVIGSLSAEDDASAPKADSPEPETQPLKPESAAPEA